MSQGALVVRNKSANMQIKTASKFVKEIVKLKVPLQVPLKVKVKVKVKVRTWSGHGQVR